MMRIKTTVYLLSGLLLAVFVNAGAIQAAGSVSASNSSILIKLTPEEKTWLAEHPTIRIGVDPDYPPFDFINENGEYQGIASDYVKLLEQRLGISMDIVADLSWSQVIEGVKAQRVDVIPLITRTPERKTFLSFTEPYVFFPTVIMTRRDYPAVNDLGDFAGKKVAVVKDYRTHKIMVKEYPAIEPYVVETPLESLKAVSVGKADAVLGNLAVNSYLVDKYSIVNLKVAGSADMGEDAFRMGVRNDWPQLVAILKKAINSITPEEQRAIRRRWIQVDMPAPEQKRLVLTKDEKSWLVKHKNIRLGVDPAWPPFEFFDAAKVYSGIASGYVLWLNEQLHINMASGPDISWAETMKKARFGDIDVLPCVGRTPDRAKFLLFTKPYLSFPMVIITRQDAPFVNGVLDFDKGRVAVIKGYVTQDLMERVYPGRDFFPADNVDQALKAVSRGKLDAFVGNLPAISYGIQKLGLTNLKVATTTPYRFELAFAVRKDWPQLVGILDKSLATMPEAEKNKIHNRWINIHFEEKTNWTLIFQLVGAIVLVAGIILIIIIRWNRALSKEVTERKRTAAALRDSRAAARGLLDATRESLFFLDGRGNVVAVNTTAAFRFQKTPEEITGTDFFELLPAEVREERRAYFDQVMQTGTPLDFEGTHAGIVMQIRFYPVKDKSGGMSGVAVFAQDITERKQAEEMIINSEQRLSQIINFMPDPAWVVDNDGKVVTWNRAVEKLTGTKAEKILGKDDFEYALPFYGERRPVLIDLIRQWNPDYEKKYVSVKKDGENLVSESFHPNLGDNGIFLSAIAGLLYDTSGEVTGAIESLRDITDQKKAEMELQKLSLAVEQSPASVVITDPLGIVEYVNPKFSELTGYSAKEVVGKNPRILNSGKLPRGHFKNLWDTILAGNEWHGEFHNKKKNGELFWEHARISPIRNKEGELTNFVAVKEDITERKRMREELMQAKRSADEANRAKGDFLANMSHEIRTPMNAVIGMSHLALKTDLTAKQRDYLKKIQSSANSLLGIINDILDFSKIEAGKMDMESVDFNLDDVLDNLANLITVKAQEKENLEVLFATAIDVPRFLKGDSLRLGQVLINLANNAVKFTETGEIVVSTELVKKDQDQVTLKFSVTDTGIGLTKEQMGRLFQSFSQADTSTTRKYGGTGLGLTISKRLVEMMGGEIRVASKPGRGTTFSFSATFGQSLGKEKTRPAPPPDLQGMKVLVVDDNATSRDIFREMLESLTFDVTLAASGEEGLTELKSAGAEHPYQLVLMDWKLPGMDGFEASRRIKNDSDLGRIPAIVLVTAYGREEVMKKTEAEGLDGFLLKPVNPSMLFDTIMQIFGKNEHGEVKAFSEKDHETETLKAIIGAHVLLVEDNEINQQVAREILAGAGLNVSIANNGLEAVDAVKENKYDAVLMDIQMPVMDGYEATKRIRKWESVSANADTDVWETEDRGQKTEVRCQASNLQPPTCNLPIIAMTAHAMAGDHEKSLDAGMVDHVTKPIDPEQLFATLAKWIRPREVSRTARPPETGSLEKSNAKVSAGASDAVASFNNQEQFPNYLAGFDLADGLRRLGGNHKLYKKLLLNFAANYSETPSEIRQALDSGDFNQAHQLVHSLKGVAGNLAAGELQAATVELEKLVKHVDKDEPPLPDALNEKLSVLGNVLNQTFEAIQTLGPTGEEKIAVTGMDQTVSLPPEIAKDAAGRLHDAAEMGDVTEVVSIAEDITANLEAFAIYKDKIVQLAEDFDFDGILELAGELEKMAEGAS